MPPTSPNPTNPSSRAQRLTGRLADATRRWTRRTEPAADPDTTETFRDAVALSRALAARDVPGAALVLRDADAPRLRRLLLASSALLAATLQETTPDENTDAAWLRALTRAEDIARHSDALRAPGPATTGRPTARHPHRYT